MNCFLCKLGLELIPPFQKYSIILEDLSSLLRKVLRKKKLKFTTSSYLCYNCYLMVISINIYEFKLKELKHNINDLYSNANKSDGKNYQSLNIWNFDPSFLDTTEPSGEINTDEKRESVNNELILKSKRVVKINRSSEFEYNLNNLLKTNSAIENYSVINNKNVFQKSETKLLESRNDFINNEIQTFSFSCISCKESFKNKQALITHSKHCYKNVTYECKICKTSLPSIGYLANHNEAFHGTSVNKDFLCDKCGRNFIRKETLERHRAKIHGVSYGKHKCVKCSKIFHHTSLLTEHVHTHKSFKCNICYKIFSCSSNLSKHKRRCHDKAISYTCCGLQWKSHSSYTHHRKKVHKKDTLSCHSCKKTFCSDTGLQRHIERLHTKTERMEIKDIKAQRSNVTSIPLLLGSNADSCVTPNDISTTAENDYDDESGLVIESAISCDPNEKVHEVERVQSWGESAPLVIVINTNENTIDSSPMCQLMDFGAT